MSVLANLTLVQPPHRYGETILDYFGVEQLGVGTLTVRDS